MTKNILIKLIKQLYEIKLIYDGMYINLFNLLLEPVIHTLKPNKEKYDFTSFLQNQYAQKDNIAEMRKNIIFCINLLKKVGYPIKEVQFSI